MSKQYFGSCLCGDIKVAVSGFKATAANCHCGMCRKFHGAAYGTLVSVEQLQWLAGRELIKEFTAPNGSVRSFCSQCGSSLGFRVKGSAFSQIELAIAIFDGPIPVTVDANIYTNYQANWCKMNDQLASFKEARTD